VGILRTSQVWIGGRGTTLATASFTPPPPEDVPNLLRELLESWEEAVENLTKASVAGKIAAMSEFHHRFVSIHPFLDGNGRIARFLLAQQARELLNQTRRVVVEDRRPYFEALSSADAGNYAPLEAVISQAVLGTEFVAGSPCQMSGQRCPSCGEGVMNINEYNNGVVCNVCELDIPA
jgi:fido (protein-threonine AMPylation protein)